jgi:double-stranded uracil-DNA glycosylase
MSVLPDVLERGLAIVFCGTAAGTASARRCAYYAGPGNRFWNTLFEVGLIPRLIAPEEFESVTEFGLGLTDLAKHVAGCDEDLPDGCFDGVGLTERILAISPGILAFTSKRAAEEYVGHPVDYGLLEETIGRTRLFVLPSPSGAARRHWDDRPWNELANRSRGAPRS